MRIPRRPSTRSFVRALLGASWLLLATCVQAQTIVNAGFEAGPAVSPATPIVPVLVGETTLTGWAVVGGGVNVIDQGYWAPQSGSRSLMLSGAAGPGGIEQTIATIVGQRYALGFWLSGDPLSPPVIKHLRVTAGTQSADFAFDSSPAWHWDMAWSPQTFTFTATAATTPIRFASLDPEPWGPTIDSVSVVPAGDPPPPVTPLALGAVQPDPVTDVSTIAYTLPEPGRVRLSVYDLRGRLLSRLRDADTSAGPHVVPLPGAALGTQPGVLFVVLETPSGRRVRRCTLLR